MKDKMLNILITGGGSGIGAALSKSLAQDNHQIVICGRREKKLKEVANNHKKILYKTCDVSDEQQVVQLKKFVKKSIKYLDVIINCAGVFGPINRFDKTNSNHWKKTFEINTFGTYLIIKHFLDLLLLSKTKKIINFSGGGAFSPFPHYSAYAVSKAAVVRLTENIADELFDYKVHINCIAPGFVTTDLHNETLLAGETAAGKQYQITKKKLKEGSVPITTPVECVKFLISEKSDGLTGKTISASFDKWNEVFFQESIKKITESDLYTLRRINLNNLDGTNELRKRLL